jgi:hypothetical protein
MRPTMLKAGAFLLLTLVGGGLGILVAQPYPVPVDGTIAPSTGPCENWTCTGAWTGGTYVPIGCDHPAPRPTCNLTTNAVATCQATNQTNCNPGHSSPICFFCRGNDANMLPCYVKFWGCN